jgi:hypothetical protein
LIDFSLLMTFLLFSRETGLVGFSVDQTGQIPITGPASSLFDGPSVQWDAESGMLLFTVAAGRRVPPAGIAEVTLSLRNCDVKLKQPCSSPPPGGGWNVGISTSGGYQGGTIDIPYSQVSVSGGLAGGWISPAFTVAAVAVEEGGRVNGLPSTMTFKVVANAPMPEMTMVKPKPWPESFRSKLKSSKSLLKKPNRNAQNQKNQSQCPNSDPENSLQPWILNTKALGHKP